MPRGPSRALAAGIAAPDVPQDRRDSRAAGKGRRDVRMAQDRRRPCLPAHRQSAPAHPPIGYNTVTSAGRSQPEPALVEDLGHGIRIDATKILKHARPRPASIVSPVDHVSRRIGDRGQGSRPPPAAPTRRRSAIGLQLRIVRHFVGDRLQPPSIDSVEAIPAGSGSVVHVNGQSCAVYCDDAGTAHALSARCTRLGCLVAFNDAERPGSAPATDRVSPWIGRFCKDRRTSPSNEPIATPPGIGRCLTSRENTSRDHGGGPMSNFNLSK